MIFSLHSVRSSTASSGSAGARIEWRGIDASDAVVALTEVHVAVSLATDRYPAYRRAIASDSSVCCEECCARRNFVRRELAAALRRAVADRESIAHDEQDKDDHPGDAPRFRVMS